MKIWEIILGILQATIPALIVFLTVYFLFKEFLKNQRQMFLFQDRKDARSEVIPLRMQAYERLALFCERIKVQSLLLRLEGNSVAAEDLRLAILITIQQEFEHNVAQQVYVSKELWKIIEMARNNTVALVNTTFESLPKGASPADLRYALFTNLEKMGEQPMDTALFAIKKEIGNLL
ncbi:MAG: hypothetical protein AB8G11_10585 [Saprospiraceae bacterium]